MSCSNRDTSPRDLSIMTLIISCASLQWFISDPRSLQVNYVRGRNSELMMRTNHLCHQLLPMYLHNTYYELPCRKKKLFVTRWQFPLQLALKHTAANCFANWIKHLEPRPFWLAATSRESLQEVNDQRVVFKGIDSIPLKFSAVKNVGYTAK